MTAGNSSKRKLNKRTKLIYGEGDNDQTWLSYLKSLFAKNQSGIKIDNGSGGSPDSVLEKMMKRREFYEYAEKYALLDSDRKEIDIAKGIAEKNGIILIVSEGCLEFELLKIYGIPKMTLKRLKSNSNNAKSEFKKICRHNPDNYKKIFPKELLIGEYKKGNNWIKELIDVFE